MSCRTIEATIRIALYPEGGSSHGDTCCLCGRPFDIADHATGRRIYLQVSVPPDAYHVSGMPASTWPGPDGYRYTKNLQADTEGCAAILARWSSVAYHDRPEFGYMICLAHDCTVITAPSRLATEEL